MASLYDIQKAFVDLLNDTDLEADAAGRPVLQLDRRRVQVYFSDIAYRRENLLKSVFPLTMKVLADHQPEIVQAYWSAYRSTVHNPIFELESFVEFISGQKQLLSAQPYLGQLAAYEWLRRSVHIFSADLAGAALKPGGPPKPGAMVVNQSCRLRCFDYPVHTIAKRVASGRWRRHSYGVDKHFMAVYQDPQDRCNLRVQDLGRLTYDLLQEINDKVLSARDFINYSGWLTEHCPDCHSSIEAEAALESVWNGLSECGILLDHG